MPSIVEFLSHDNTRANLNLQSLPWNLLFLTCLSPIENLFFPLVFMLPYFSFSLTTKKMVLGMTPCYVFWSKNATSRFEYQHTHHFLYLYVTCNRTNDQSNHEGSHTHAHTQLRVRCFKSDRISHHYHLPKQTYNLEIIVLGSFLIVVFSVFGFHVNWCNRLWVSW